MTFEFLFITMSPGLLTIDIPTNSTFIIFSIGFWVIMYIVNFVLGILKRIPFL